jgi:hypothetical protein
MRALRPALMLLFFFIISALASRPEPLRASYIIVEEI